MLFLLAQAADGVMTYVGVTTLGVHLEANPLLASLMAAFGQGTALTGAKLLASGLGISLHLIGTHRILARPDRHLLPRRRAAVGGLLLARARG